MQATFIRSITLITFIFFSTLPTSAQDSTLADGIIITDTIINKYLPEITIVGKNTKTDIHQLPEIVGTSIYAGKKNALIVMDNVQANVVTNNMRQVMAKVPGIHVWESDGSGIQIGIAARGLSPNRSWEFNVRQNGYDISADPFGYPEAYYNPQLQAVQRIEVVRGQGALQYGPQFGGLVNYILRNGSDMQKPFEAEIQQTVGNNGLFNSFVAVGGQTKKLHYYAYYDHRTADGWRQNSRYGINSGYATLTYKFTERFSVTAEVMHAHQRMQQPGGLTDVQFNQNSRQSFRERNWFDVRWTTLALIGNYTINGHSRINVKAFGILGDRNSLGFLRPITVADTINRATGQYNNRTLDIDNYRNAGIEARYITDYTLGKMTNTFSAGVRYYQGTTYRYRDGKGDAGFSYVNRLVDGIWPRDIDYHSVNTSAFAENVFRFNKLLIIPGIRYEFVHGAASGINGFDGSGNAIPLQRQARDRSFVIAGIGAEYHITPKTEIYGNFTQAYRPMQFADLTAPPTTEVIDTDLQDAKGFNLDVGYRGKIKSFLFFDISAYYLQYNNRIGTITQQRADGSFYNFRTNVGNSASKGIESLVEWSILRTIKPSLANHELNMFVSYSFTDARFGSLKVVNKVGNDLVETNLRNRFVENAPEHIFRGGFTYSFKNLSFTTQISHVSDAFADANNTVTPTANGQNGLIPAYTVTDLHIGYKYKRYNVRAGINNLTDERYFTRRAGGYPGPGILPADGRTWFFSFGATL